MLATVELTRSRDAAGNLEFLAGRCRPNTVLAVACDLKVFFTAVGKPPRRVRVADVLAFMTAQRTGVQARLHLAGEDAGGVSARTLRRRLSSVSGLYGFLHARGDVIVNPVPRACRPGESGSGPVRASRWSGSPDASADPGAGRGGCADRGAAHPPGPGDGRDDGAGRAAPLRGPRAAAG